MTYDFTTRSTLSAAQQPDAVQRACVAVVAVVGVVLVVITTPAGVREIR